MKALKEITEEGAICRYENAIHYKNGKVAILYGDLAEGYKVSEMKDIDDLLETEPDGWTHIYFMQSDQTADYIAYAGETSYGGCGFIALKTKVSDEFEWVIHLENCNNLFSVYFESDKVVAISDEPYPKGSKIIIEIDRPDQIKTLANK